MKRAGKVLRIGSRYMKNMINLDRRSNKTIIDYTRRQYMGLANG